MTKRVAVGVYNDGFIHAGNLAYLSVLAIFPFFILAAAIARLLGQSQDAELTVDQRSFGPCRPMSRRRCAGRSPKCERAHRRLLWFGALVGLWTAASFIETIRDILRRAYGVTFSAPFWEYRLGSIALIIAAVVLAMIAFAAR